MQLRTWCEHRVVVASKARFDPLGSKLRDKFDQARFDPLGSKLRDKFDQARFDPLGSKLRDNPQFEHQLTSLVWRR
jgi:hypothetical protein